MNLGKCTGGAEWILDVLRVLLPIRARFSPASNGYYLLVAGHSLPWYIRSASMCKMPPLGTLGPIEQPLSLGRSRI